MNEDSRSAAAAVVVGPPAVGGHLLLDDGRGPSGSASSAGINDSIVDK